MASQVDSPCSLNNKLTRSHVALVVGLGLLLCSVVTGVLSRRVHVDSKLFVATPSVNIGKVPINSSVSFEFRLENRTTEPIEFSGIQTFCGCTSAKADVTEIAPGASAILKLTAKTGITPRATVWTAVVHYGKMELRCRSCQPEMRPGRQLGSLLHDICLLP
jgi:hypothetical protein